MEGRGHHDNNERKARAKRKDPVTKRKETMQRKAELEAQQQGAGRARPSSSMFVTEDPGHQAESPTQTWILKNFVRMEGKVTKVQDAYCYYKIACTGGGGLPPLKDSIFGKEMRAAFKPLKTRRLGPRAANSTFYANLQYVGPYILSAAPTMERTEDANSIVVGNTTSPVMTWVPCRGERERREEEEEEEEEEIHGSMIKRQRVRVELARTYVQFATPVQILNSGANIERLLLSYRAEALIVLPMNPACHNQMVVRSVVQHRGEKATITSFCSLMTLSHGALCYNMFDDTRNFMLRAQQIFEDVQDELSYDLAQAVISLIYWLPFLGIDPAKTAKCVHQYVTYCLRVCTVLPGLADTDLYNRIRDLCKWINFDLSSWNLPPRAPPKTYFQSSWPIDDKVKHELNWQRPLFLDFSDKNMVASLEISRLKEEIRSGYSYGYGSFDFTTTRLQAMALREQAVHLQHYLHELKFHRKIPGRILEMHISWNLCNQLTLANILDPAHKPELAKQLVEQLRDTPTSVVLAVLTAAETAFYELLGQTLLESGNMVEFGLLEEVAMRLKKLNLPATLKFAIHVDNLKMHWGCTESRISSPNCGSSSCVSLGSCASPGRDLSSEFIADTSSPQQQYPFASPQAYLQQVDASPSPQHFDPISSSSYASFPQHRVVQQTTRSVQHYQFVQENVSRFDRASSATTATTQSSPPSIVRSNVAAGTYEVISPDPQLRPQPQPQPRSQSQAIPDTTHERSCEQPVIETTGSHERLHPDDTHYAGYQRPVSWPVQEEEHVPQASPVGHNDYSVQISYGTSTPAHNYPSMMSTIQNGMVGGDSVWTSVPVNGHTYAATFTSYDEHVQAVPPQHQHQQYQQPHYITTFVQETTTCDLGQPSLMMKQTEVLEILGFDETGQPKPPTRHSRTASG